MPRWLSRAVLAAAVAVVPVAAPTGAAAQASPARQAHTNIARGHPAGAATLVTPTPGGYFPCDLAGAYRLGSVAGTGAGLTIAIVDAYDLAAAPADFQTFNDAFPTYFAGSAGSLHRLNLGAPTNSAVANPPWNDEIDQDIEWAHAIAPDAAIWLVEAVDGMEPALLSAISAAVGGG